MSMVNLESLVYSIDTDLAKVADKNKVTVIILNPNRLNLWFLRDDEGKNFFKWWSQVYGTPAKQIRALLIRNYVKYPAMTNMSDQRLLHVLRNRYPNGKELRLGGFNVYVIKP